MSQFVYKSSETCHGTKGNIWNCKFICIKFILSKLSLTILHWVVGSIWDFYRTNYKCKTLNWICFIFIWDLHLISWREQLSSIHRETSKTEGKYIQTNIEDRQTDRQRQRKRMYKKSKKTEENDIQTNREEIQTHSETRHIQTAREDEKDIQTNREEKQADK